MSLMVWFRKHNKKIMAVVVIALMIVFTIQPVMDYFSSDEDRRGEGNRLLRRRQKDKQAGCRDGEPAD